MEKGQNKIRIYLVTKLSTQKNIHSNLFLLQKKEVFDCHCGSTRYGSSWTTTYHVAIKEMSVQLKTSFHSFYKGNIP